MNKNPIMFYKRTVLVGALLFTTLLGYSCTNEFTWTEPPKWEPKPKPDPSSYDVTMETLLDEMISFDEAPVSRNCPTSAAKRAAATAVP